MRTVLGRQRDGALREPRHYYALTALGAGDPRSGHVGGRGPYERWPHFLDGAFELRDLDELGRDRAGAQRRDGHARPTDLGRNGLRETQDERLGGSVGSLGGNRLKG